MSMLNLIPEGQEEKPTTVYQTIVKHPEEKKVSREKLVNGVLITVVIILFVSVLATYFVKDLPDVIVSIRDITKQALWVFVGVYAIGELLKIVFINRARTSTEYKEAKEAAENELKKIVSEKKSDRVKEYCEWYETTLFEDNQKLALAGSNISYETYKCKYMALRKKEILAKYPSDDLSKLQLKAIKRANAVKKEKYNPEFLFSTQNSSVIQSVPSKRYNSKARESKDTIFSAGFGSVGSFFGVSFANEIIFNLSKEIILAAVIKVVVLTLGVAIKLIFANSLVFDTEIGRFNLQTEESKAYLRWYDETPMRTKDETKVETVPCGDMEAVEG